MTALTVAAALSIATACAAGIDPTLLVGIAKTESGLDPSAIHHNPNGTTDTGAWQINSSNLTLLHITQAETFDPCKAVKAAATLLQLESRYNSGSPTASMHYAASVTQAAYAVKAGSTESPTHTAASPELPASIFARPSPGRALIFTNTSKR